MADVYEQNLASKSTLTTTDYIRVVGSDNVSYKQLVSDVAKKIIENYTGSTLAGSAQSVKSALDSLNSKTAGNLTAGTNMTLAAGYNNCATKVGRVVVVDFALTASADVAGSSVVATIPSGYRPTTQMRGVCYFTDGFARFAVDAAGNITSYTNIGNNKSIIGTIAYII